MLRSEPPPTDPPEPPGDLAADAVEVFQPHYAEPLTLDDGHAITRNLGDVLSLLREWREEARPLEEVPAPAPDVAAQPEMVSGKAPRRPRGRKFPAEIP